MFSIVSQQQEVTMSSLDFLNDYINPSRVKAGQSSTSNTHFLARVLDELEIGDDKIFTTPHPQNNKPQHCVNLDYDQLMLVGMRESKAVRKSVLAKLKELSSPKEDPMVLLAKQVLKLDEENKRLASTKAHINNKRTATLMNKASQAARSRSFIA